MKRACEKQKLARLAESFRSHSEFGAIANQQQPTTSTGHGRDRRHDAASDTEETSSRRDHSAPAEVDSDGAANRNASAARVALESDLAAAEAAAQPQLTQEDMQTFQRENDQLFDDLSALTDEVQQIGGKVVEIARLQEIFTDKVLQQEQDLTRLNDAVISTTENIRGGNEQLREAMRKSAGLRVWILFFIITLAFTVLFLDWYNP